MGSRSLEKMLADKAESAAKDKEKSEDRFDKAIKDGIKLATDLFEKGGMRKEVGLILKSSVDPEGALRDAAAASIGGQGRLQEQLEIGPKGKADVSVGKMLPGVGMLEAGSAKTNFGDGIDLELRLDLGGLDARHSDASEKVDKDTSLVDKFDPLAAADARLNRDPLDFDPLAAADARLNRDLLGPRPSMTPFDHAAINSFITKELRNRLGLTGRV